MDVRLVIGTNARKFRLALDLSQEAVAAQMGVDRAYISGLELGKANPTAVTLSRLADVLGVRVAALLDERLPDEDSASRQRAGKQS
jgi:transcriptional regulator with XRE-family HTH domain